MSETTVSGRGDAAVHHRWRDALILVVLGLLAQVRALGGDFHYDDLHSIVANPHIRSLDQIPSLLTDPTTFSGLAFGGMFRPLVMVSYAVTYAVFGTAASPFLATNLILHITVILMVWGVLHRFFAERLCALVPAALFAVHPVNVETVAYISSRSESMCALFMLAALWCYGRPNRWSQVLGVLSFAAALACKSVGIVLLPLLVLYEFWYVDRRASRRLLALLPYGVVAVGYLSVVTGLLTRSLLQAPVRALQIQLLTQIKALIYYLQLLCVPWGLSVEHQFHVGHLTQPVVWFAVLLVASLVVVAWKSHPGRGPRWWMLWGVVVLLPTLIIPLNVLVNEHRLYMVSAAFAVLIARLVLPASLRVQRAGIVAIAILAVLAFQRSAVWADSQTLWQDALAKGPLMPRPHLFVGDAEAAAGRYGAALLHYQQALVVNPQQLSAADQLVIHNNTGAALLALGAFAEAREAYGRALQIDADYPPSRDALQGLEAFASSSDRQQALADRRTGLSAMVAGDMSAAIRYLRQSLAVVDHGGAWLALASCHERIGQADQAREIYRMLMLSEAGGAADTAAKRLQLLGQEMGDR